MQKHSSDLPIDPPEVVQARIQVENLHDLLADSEPVWQPIYSESTLFGSGQGFLVAKTVKKSLIPSYPPPRNLPTALAIGLDLWSRLRHLGYKPQEPRLFPENDPLKNF